MSNHEAAREDNGRDGSTAQAAAGPGAPKLLPGPSSFRPESSARAPHQEQPAKAPGRTSRFALLAASVALLAGIGGAAGSIGTAKLMPIAATPVARTTPAASPEEVRAVKDAVAQLRGSVKGLGDQVANLRATVDSMGKSTGAQFGKVTESIDRIERTQSEPAAKLAKVIETLERLERRAAALPTPIETTGSIPSAPAVADARETAAPVVDGWRVRRVYDGVALIQSRRGIAEVEAGDTIPGVGRVHQIRRDNGKWVVVTSQGLIVSH